MRMWLAMRRADGGERTFPLDRPRTVIGRETRCDIRVPLPSIADAHCELRIESEVLIVIDLGSDEGTRHNGDRVERAILADRDSLTVGPVTFTVCFDAVGGTETGSYAVEPKSEATIDPPTITTRRPSDQPAQGEGIESA